MSKSSDFDVESEVAKLKAQTKSIRAGTYKNRVSKLDIHSYELLRLYRSGATAAELKRWLNQKHHLSVAHSTILRWLEKNG